MIDIFVQRHQEGITLILSDFTRLRRLLMRSFKISIFEIILVSLDLKIVNVLVFHAIQFENRLKNCELQVLVCHAI